MKQTPPSPPFPPKSPTPAKRPSVLVIKHEDEQVKHVCKECWFMSKNIYQGMARCSIKKCDLYVNSIACPDYDDTPVF